MPKHDYKLFDTTISDPVARIQKYIDSYKYDTTYKVRSRYLSHHPGYHES